MTIDVKALLAGLPARIDAIPRTVASRTPDAPALIEDGRTISYRQLVEAIDRQAALLRELGVRPGDRVLLVSENCAAQVALVFAAATLDAWIVNVNARLSAPELEAIRVHSGARVNAYTAAVSPEARAHAEHAGARAYGDLMIGPLNEDCAPEPQAAEPIAALVYTTGTTGQPKGVMLSHRNLLFVAAVSSRLRGLVPQDRAWGVLPISHVYGLTSVMLGTLCAGACLQLAPRFTPDGMLAAIRDEGLTIVQGVPAMYARMLEKLGDQPLPSKLRFAYAGGSPLDPDLKRRVESALGVPLHNGYGLSEAAPTVSQTRLDAPRADTSVGTAIPGVELRIVGKDGVDLAGGRAGELWVRGPNVMQGYYRAPEQTVDAIKAGGWLNTGDMARQDPDGALFIVGRTRELIIRSGFNVFPLEVETVLNAHPAVTQSAVVGRLQADGNEEVVAFVQPAPRARGSTHGGTQLSADALRAWAAERLAPYKRPSRIVLMEALPAAATGKVLKHVLKTMAAQD
jgi:acyl-CoA synthetase (AMP-forming)/AMP-acid ligase II